MENVERKMRLLSQDQQIRYSKFVEMRDQKHPLHLTFTDWLADMEALAEERYKRMVADRAFRNEWIEITPEAWREKMDAAAREIDAELEAKHG